MKEAVLESFVKEVESLAKDVELLVQKDKDMPECVRLEHALYQPHAGQATSMIGFKGPYEQLGQYHT